MVQSYSEDPLYHIGLKKGGGLPGPQDLFLDRITDLANRRKIPSGIVDDMRVVSYAEDCDPKAEIMFSGTRDSMRLLGEYLDRAKIPGRIIHSATKQAETTRELGNKLNLLSTIPETQKFTA